jgi:hypothetical protein
VDPPRKRDIEFEDVIRATAVEMGLAPDDDFVLRVVQLSELLAIRHCVFLMGPTGSGRTEAYRVLARAITRGTERPVNDYLKMTNKQKVGGAGAGAAGGLAQCQGCSAGRAWGGSCWQVAASPSCCWGLDAATALTGHACTSLCPIALLAAHPTALPRPATHASFARPHAQIVIRDINPKSISTQELYGYVNMATREWKDGLLSYNMRELSNVPDDNPKWIMLDGDLDANWIESMNSAWPSAAGLVLGSCGCQPQLGGPALQPSWRGALGSY